MAAAADDPRAMLKAARKDRRITHPHASYTSTGSLLCNLCSSSIKSEAQWNAHLHSAGHTLRLSGERDAKVARSSTEQHLSPSPANGNGNGKKRKASVAEEEGYDERKKLKGLADMAKGVDVTSQPAHLEKSPSTWSGATAGQRPNARTPVDLVSEAKEDTSTQQEPFHDEAGDLAALEANLAALEREARATANPQANPTSAHPASLSGNVNNNSNNNIGATISAPAMTAEQLAAQDREEQSAQRGKRDVELEDEKEEAAARLEEEFEDQKAYEERVKRLRERRERARVGPPVDGEAVAAGTGELHADGVDGKIIQEGVNDGEDEDDGDEEDYDDWGFGAR